MIVFFFFFKQKTAYEMRISDWSSDVCSSDLAGRTIGRVQSVKDGANGRIDSVLVKTSEGIAALPADQLSFSGSGLLSAMTRAEVRKMADEPSSAVNAAAAGEGSGSGQDRKSTRLNSSH